MTSTGMTAAAPAPVAVPTSAATTQPEHTPAPPARPKWQKYVTPALVVLLAAALVVTISRNWNAWAGGKIEQVTDDAYVRGDITPLSTKVAGIVRDVKVADYQAVHERDLIAELEDAYTNQYPIPPVNGLIPKSGAIGAQKVR